MIKVLLLLLTFLLGEQTSAQQQRISKEDWQSDVRYLHKTVHESFPFLFKKTTAKEFDSKVDNLYKNIPEMEDHEIVVGFAKIVSSFKYGHTKLSFGSSPVPIEQLPLKIYEFTDGIYITGAHKDYRSILGTKITKIEDKPIADVLKAVYPVVPAENEYYFKAYGISYALMPAILHSQKITENLQDNIKFTLEKEGKQFNTIVSVKRNISFPWQYGEAEPNDDWVWARDLSGTPLYLKNLEKKHAYEYLQNEKALYVRSSQILDNPNESMISFYKRVFSFVENNEVEKLIIDLRLNGGGNNFNNKAVVTGIIEQRKINQKGKLFVIIGRRTFSAAQNLVNRLENYTNVTFVGEPTAENINFYGDAKRIRLPKSRLNVYLSFAWWQDKAMWANADYTRPDIKVQMTFEEYRSNQDPVLDVILAKNTQKEY